MDIQQACAVGFRSWLELIAARLADDGWERNDAREEAVLVLSAIEGALVLARAERDPAPLRTVGRRLGEQLKRSDPRDHHRSEDRCGS
jgi:TetR/AcrR family transcriptional repressor of lmrAB and yxaGH operons